MLFDIRIIAGYKKCVLKNTGFILPGGNLKNISWGLVRAYAVHKGYIYVKGDIAATGCDVIVNAVTPWPY